MGTTFSTCAWEITKLPGITALFHQLVTMSRQRQRRISSLLGAALPGHVRLGCGLPRQGLDGRFQLPESVLPGAHSVFPLLDVLESVVALAGGPRGPNTRWPSRKPPMLMVATSTVAKPKTAHMVSPFSAPRWLLR